jgi:hypothetical protein
MGYWKRVRQKECNGVGKKREIDMGIKQQTENIEMAIANRYGIKTGAS